MYGRTCTQLQTLTPMTYSCQKKLKSRAKRKVEGQRKFAAKINEIKEAIKLVLESLHQKLRIVNTRTTKSGIISRIILLLENKKSVKEEWIISNKWTFKSERERSDKKKLTAKTTTTQRQRQRGQMKCKETNQNVQKTVSVEPSQHQGLEIPKNSLKSPK